MPVDEARLNEFLGQFVADLGATGNAAMVVIGHRLGLYRAMAGAPPVTPAELAERTGTAPRYVTEWLAAQAASGYVTVAERGAVRAHRRSRRSRFRSGRAAVPARRVRPRAGRAEGRAADRRGVPHRRGPGLARAGRRGLRRLRAVLRARLPGQPGPVLDPGAGRRRGQAAPRRQGRRCRLRSRRVHQDHGRGVPGLGVRRLRLPRPGRSSGPARPPPMPGWPTGCASRWPAPTSSPAPAMTWSRRSIACTTWASPVAAAAAHPRGPGRRTAPGCWSSPPRPTIWRATSTRSAGSTTPSPPAVRAERAGPGAGVVLGNQAGEARTRQIVTEAGFTRFRRVAQTPFNLVFEARP